MHLGRIYKIIIFFFLFHSTSCIAQDTLNSALVEQKSYQLYLDKNWDELIKYGNNAVDKGYDYFYLQMRIGIAWFEKNNYRVAENHFKSALNFNSDDDLAQEYLYFCYLYAGKHDEAKVLSKTFSLSLAKKTGTDTASSLSFFIVEGGSKMSDSSSYYDKRKKANSNYFNPAIYFQVGFGHYIKNRVSLFHAVTYFNQDEFRGKTIQFQYYLQAGIPIKNNWSVSPSIHWINKNYTPTVFQPPPQGMGPRPKPKQPTSSKTNYFVGSLEIKKSISRFDLAVGTTVSNIDTSNQYIHSLSVNYYPFGNNRLSLGGTYFLHTESNYSELNSGTSLFLTMRPIKRFSITVAYLYNQKNNFIEKNGFIVNNSMDFTPSRYSVLASYSFGKHVDLYGLYQFENKTEKVQKFNYHYNTFIIGLKIIP